MRTLTPESEPSEPTKDDGQQTRDPEPDALELLLQGDTIGAADLLEWQLRLFGGTDPTYRQVGGQIYTIVQHGAEETPKGFGVRLCG